MNKKSKMMLIAAIWALFGTLQAISEVITYTETTNFSPNLGFPYIVPGTLGIGNNTITGSLQVDEFFADVDVFHVNNFNEYLVQSITVDVSNFVGTTTNPMESPGALRLESPGFRNIAVWNNGQFELLTAPSNAPIFEFRFIGPEDFFIGPEDFLNFEVGGMDYIVTIVAVPEPSVIALLFGALAVITVIKRRKKNLI